MPYEKFQNGTKKDLSEEIPFELPQGWAWARLGHVAKTISAKPYQIFESEIQKQGRFPVVSQGRDRIDGYCDAEGKVLSDLPLILFGDHTRAVKYIDFPFVIGADGTKLLKPYTNAKWLYLWTCHAAKIQLKSRGYGRHWNLLNLLLIPLPPLAEQLRIVAKTDELFIYADKVSATDNRIGITAQRLDKKILDLAIKGQLIPQDPNDEPASELLKRIHAAKEAGRSPRDRRAAESVIFRGSDRLAYETVNGKTVCIQDEIPFEIPDSWAWARLGTALMPMETKLPRGEWFGYVDIDAIDNKHNVVLSPKRLATTKAPIRASRGLKPGDTLFSVVRPYLRNIAYVDESLSDCIASTGFYVCRPCVINSRFLFRLLLSDYVVNGINAFMKGDNSPSVRTSHIQNLLVPIPPLDEQRRITEKVELLKTIIDGLKT